MESHKTYNFCLRSIISLVIGPFYLKVKSRVIPLILPLTPSVYPISLFHKVKTHYLHFRSHTDYFLLSWKIPEETTRRSILFLKGVSTISHIMYIQPFSMEVH